MIVFERITYQNFRTVGNSPIEVDFTNSKSTLITGKNGHGKSTLIHAMCYALFNRAYGDDITLPQLVNTINTKKCLVTIEFTSGTKKYKVIRGMKPKVFQIYEDGVLLNEDGNSRDYQSILENQILKFNYRSFTQVVVIGGSDYKPFMKMKTEDRRKFIEDLLDIRIFSVMNTLLKEYNKEVKEDLGAINTEINRLTNLIESQKSFIETLEKEKGDSILRVKSTVERLSKELEEFAESQSGLIDKIDKYREKLKPFGKLHETLISVRTELKQIKTKQAEVTEYVDFINDTPTCPTCNQDISDTHKDAVKTKYGSTLTKLDEDIQTTLEHIEELKGKVELHDKIEAKINEFESELIQLNQQIKSHNRQIAQGKADMAEMLADTVSLDAEKKKYEDSIASIAALDEKKTKVLEQKQEYEFIGDVLSDSGIKSKIIKNYIPTINALINKFLNDMDFFVSFNLDEEFNEVIKSRYRDTFTYGCFSDGQKARIDLALMFSWREMARLRNAVNCNIAFFDEADKALDLEGASFFSDIIKRIKVDNVFVISHKGNEIAEKYDRVLNMELVNNFTVMKA